MAFLASLCQELVKEEEVPQSMGTYSKPLPRLLVEESQLYAQVTFLPLKAVVYWTSLKGIPRLPPLLEPELEDAEEVAAGAEDATAGEEAATEVAMVVG